MSFACWVVVTAGRDLVDRRAVVSAFSLSCAARMSWTSDGQTAQLFIIPLAAERQVSVARCRFDYARICRSVTTTRVSFP